MAWNEAAERRGFVQRVVRRMRILNLTQLDVAKRLQSSTSSVSVQLDPNATAWWAGEKMVRAPSVLQCNANWLFLNRGAEVEPDASPSQHYLEGYRAAMDDMRLFLEQREPSKPRLK